MKPNKLCILVIFTLLLGVAVAMGQEKSGLPEKLGKVHFPISCSPTAQAQFERAVALLHSFWYEEAVTAFTALTQTEPSCAMGYWGGLPPLL